MYKMMKKLLVIIVLGLLWAPSVFAEIDAEKIKTIKCELGSVEQSGEKLSEEMIEQFYKEGGLKTEIFRIIIIILDCICVTYNW